MSYAKTIGELAHMDQRVMVLTAENRAHLQGLPDLLKERFVDTGITEQTLVGMAAGLALRGRVPVIHALATFLTMRPFEFIRSDIGIGNLPVKLVGFIPGILSEANGPTHQALEDVALMRGIPGMTVFCPADLEDLLEGLESFIAYDGPGYLRYVARPSLVKHSRALPFWKSEVFSEGKDVAVLVSGALFSETFQAVTLLSQEGLTCRLINVRGLSPLDDEPILNSLQEFSCVVTVEDHFKRGGLYSAVCELAVAHEISTKIASISLESRWFKPALLKGLLEYEKLTPLHLASRIKKYFEESNEQK